MQSPIPHSAAFNGIGFTSEKSASASGKSFVCQRLIARGYEVYDCDSAAKRLMRTSPELQQQMKALVGSLEKADIAKFLLESEANAKAIDAIVHPAVFRDFEASGMKWMESAILYESGAYRLARCSV